MKHVLRQPQRMYAIFCKETLPKFKGNRGKIAAMAGHAYLHAYWDAMDRFPFQAWPYKDNTELGATKICLIVDTIEELLAIKERLKNLCGNTLVTCDSTVFEGETVIACIGLGPVYDDGDVRKSLSNIPMFV